MMANRSKAALQRVTPWTFVLGSLQYIPSKSIRLQNSQYIFLHLFKSEKVNLRMPDRHCLPR